MKKLSLILCAALCFALLTACGASEPEYPSADFHVTGVTVNNGTAFLKVHNLSTEEDTVLKLGNEAELANALHQYRNSIKLHAFWDENDRMMDYTVLDAESGQDLGKLDADGLFAQYDPQAKYKTEDRTYTKDVAISSLEENIVYAYDMGDDHSQFVLMNDTDKNVCIYGSDSNFPSEEHQLHFAKNIGTPAVQLSFGVFSDTYYIRCAFFADEEASDYLTEEELLPLSTCQVGQTVTVDAAVRCVCNDTDAALTLTPENGDAVTLEPGETAGIDSTSVPVFTIS